MARFSSPPRLICREIVSADMIPLVDLLARGFYPSRREDWAQRLHLLAQHSTPAGFPEYGYVLECENTLVGASLVIYSSVLVDGKRSIRCNDSSWYVEPEFRSYASMLASHGRGHKNVTYFNVTPERRTLPILEARGYVGYSNGQFATFPALCAGNPSDSVKLVAAAADLDNHLPRADIEMLNAHESYGCISVTCIAESGAYPFIFVPRRKFGFIPHVHLIYCRDVSDFVRFAPQLGRFLAKRNFFLALLDSNGPIPGLVGAYFPGHPKYFKGPDRPRLGDLAYSELAMFPRLGESTPWEMLVKKFSRMRSNYRNGQVRSKGMPDNNHLATAG
jgi:hypothetical protein